MRLNLRVVANTRKEFISALEYMLHKLKSNHCDTNEFSSCGDIQTDYEFIDCDNIFTDDIGDCIVVEPPPPT